MSISIGALELTGMLALMAALLSIPCAMVLLGIHQLDRSRHVSGVILTGIGLPALLGCLCAFAWILDTTGPHHSGILSQGTSPHGLEYCVIQTHSGSRFEGYQVSFYIRDDTGAWQWNYLEHDDLAWRSARVEFTGDVATVFRNEKSFRDVAVPTGVYVDSLPVNERHNGKPARCTVADLLRIQNEDFGPR